MRSPCLRPTRPLWPFLLGALVLPQVTAPPRAALATPAPEDDERMVIEEDVPPVTASRLPIPKRELPATVNSVSAETLQERGQVTFSDALTNVAGVNPSLRYGGFDHVTIRGFGGTDFLILQDGFRDERHPVVGGEAPIGAMPGLDRIEVLKGPASVLYGVSALGGVINVIRKQPSSEAKYEAGMRFGTYEERQAWLGATGPVAQGLGSKLLYRLDLQSSSSNDFRGLATRHAGATGRLDFRPADAHQLTLRLVYLQSHFNTDAGLPTFAGGVPGDMDVRNRYNSPFDSLEYQDLRGQLGYSVQVTPGFSLHERFSVTSVREPYFSTETIGIDPSRPGQVVRETFGFNHHMRPMIGNQLEARLRGHALVEHNLVAGYDLNYYRNRSPSGFTELTPVDRLRPVETQGDPGFAYRRQAHDRRLMHGLFVSDQATLHETLRLALGGRVDFFDRTARRDTLDRMTGAVTTRGTPVEDALVAPSYRAGLVYLPARWLSAWTGVNTSVKAALPSARPAEPRTFRPERGQQVEAGARLDPFDGRLNLDLAVFYIRKRNLVVIQPPTTATQEPVFEQAGRARSLGAEADLTLNLGALRLVGGYTFTDARYQRFSSGGKDFGGNFLRDVPRHSATFWTTYRTAHGLGAGIGGRLGGDAYVDDANDIRMPRFFIADASLFYDRGPARVQLNVRNLFDENVLTSTGRYYVATIYQQVTPGPPRVVSLQISTNF
jgi:iron complex outermembrane receptor protein